MALVGFCGTKDLHQLGISVVLCLADWRSKSTFVDLARFKTIDVLAMVMSNWGENFTDKRYPGVPEFNRDRDWVGFCDTELILFTG